MRLTFSVALRKESVDRNPLFSLSIPHIEQSLSARRAWIEILMSINRTGSLGVALRKESVDRNKKLAGKASALLSRSPQGERG